MKYLLSHLKRYRVQSILAPLFKMLEALFDLFVPLVVAHIVNVCIPADDRGGILRSSGLLILMAVIGLLCSFTAQYFAAKAAVGASTALRRQLFAHIQTLSFSDTETIGASTLITRLIGDIEQVKQGLNQFLRLFLRSPFIVFGAMICAFLIDRRIALIFAVVIPALAVVIFGIRAVTAPLFRKNQQYLDLVTGLTRENLSGARVVRAFGREENETAAFTESADRLSEGQLHVGRIAALLGPLTAVIINLGIIAVLYSGALSVDAGSLQNGDVIALVNYMSQILVELLKLADMTIYLSKTEASLTRIAQILDTPPSMTFPEVSAPSAETDEAVRFDDVGLTYAGAGAESVSHLSFAAKRGQVVGVIGGTGSGKTTLVSLIPRFYDATSGSVSLMGRPIGSFSNAELRKTVGIVMQKAHLFAGTVRSNLLWGNPNASDDELWEALRLAQAEEFIRTKSGGLDEPVEQGGRNFSGGQRQRLTIARALVGKPDILILDDSASALDYATDAALRKALRTLRGTTVFIVSQRTASIRHADLILVLDDGGLVGSGRHEELLQSCPVYREIYDSQFQKGDED